MAKENEDDLYGDLTEFDFMMAAMSIYCMTSMDKEQFWTIINHVNDVFEFDTAVAAQEELMNIVERHNDMNRYFNNGKL